MLYWEYFWETIIPSHIGKLESVDCDDESEEDSGKANIEKFDEELTKSD